MLYNEAVQAINIANAIAKRYFDRKHIPLLLNPGDKVFLKLNVRYTTPDKKGKLAARRTGPFTVKRNIRNLAYELDIPREFRCIHPVISVTHLEPAPKVDPYGREYPEPGPLEMKGDTEDFKSFEVKKLLAKRTVKIGGKQVVQYRLKWKGYTPIVNEWYDKELLENCPVLIEDFEKREAAATKPAAPQPTRRSQRQLPRRRGGRGQAGSGPNE